MANGGSRGWGWPWSILTLVLGLGALVFGATEITGDAVEASRTSDPIEATVVGVEYASGTGLSKRYFPTVEYTVDGTTYEESTQNHRGTEPDIGSTVSVSYDREDPQRVSLTAASGGGGADWGGSIMLLIGGVALISAAVGFSPVVQSRRR